MIESSSDKKRMVWSTPELRLIRPGSSAEAVDNKGLGSDGGPPSNDKS